MAARRTAARVIVAAAVAALIAAAWLLDLHRYLTLEALKAAHGGLVALRRAHPLLVAGGYALTYVLVTALSLPGAAVMTLAGGAVFGLAVGTVIVSFASSIGATLAFLASRFLLGEWVQERYGDRLRAVNEGIEREGAFYLFTLRLVPVFPFFVINLVMGLTRMPVWTYYWVSQVGMLPATIVYVNAGRELARIDSPAGILSPGLLASFALLGLLPLLSRRAVAFWRARRGG
ncbi:TVP38/TMEM64 family protein [Dissulfurirhabdus thermomarina]|uniref:TVP38/TMEM64 family membrane protein n=1 Tax=Dissulfurirhabdus thermomarina TaxID=1765737 RepID=A0A6N9TNG8_DISTH|nr:TVP38/TMEM64 family protein [Dissulfurirhabdus thermomarina]NDY42831.1 TVP38/TMEM64 family protein [Dissulfurirhabdus thermomarina]NMX23626.1 TVP38/TMEM64 family protein [Dissulfurirhabdus thermomarina]